MDHTSIITQVSRDEDHLNQQIPAVDSKDKAAREKKSKRRGFLKSLLCCFVPKSKPSPDTISNGSADQTHTNGHPSPAPSSHFILPPVRHQDMHKKCMVLDLDETLVHSSFKPVSNADFIVPVEIDGTIHQVYVLKRPYVDDFLQKVGELYEVVLFTASLSKYADPVANLLDKWGVFKSRLFRESCVFHRGNYVKDVSKLGRDVENVVIVDNSPASYIFHPQNAVAVGSWFDDMTDTELLDLLPFFEQLSRSDNVVKHLEQHPLSSLQLGGGDGGDSPHLTTIMNEVVLDINSIQPLMQPLVQPPSDSFAINGQPTALVAS